MKTKQVKTLLARLYLTGQLLPGCPGLLSYPPNRAVLQCSDCFRNGGMPTTVSVSFRPPCIAGSQSAHDVAALPYTIAARQAESGLHLAS